ENGVWNDAAIEHYAAVLQAMRDRGIEPVVTLHHFTNPVWFARAGGWLGSGCVERFARYVEYVASRLKGVRYWVTINEPTILVKRGYVGGVWPPFFRNAPLRALKALRALARAHVAAYRVLHRIDPDALVSFAHSAALVVPCDSRRP